METTIPISIAVLGDPLVEMITIAWSATAGMVPQSLLFNSEGGRAETTLTSQDPQSESIQYHAQITFSQSQSGCRSGWNIEIHGVIPINAGGDAIVIDLRSWIHHLVLQFHDQDQSQTCNDSNANASIAPTDHLVVNLVWQGTHLSAPVKCSQRMTPNSTWDVFYICPEEEKISVTLSAFGVLDRQLIKLPAQSIDPTRSPLSLCASHHKLQLT